MLMKFSSGFAKKRLLIITIISLLIVSLISAVIYFFIDYSQKIEAQAVSSSLVDSINNKDSDTGYNLFTEPYKEEINIYGWYIWSKDLTDNKLSVSNTPKSTTRDDFFNLLNPKFKIIYDISDGQQLELAVSKIDGKYGISYFSIIRDK